jgi:hypothetical protein
VIGVKVGQQYQGDPRDTEVPQAAVGRRRIRAGVDDHRGVGRTGGGIGRDRENEQIPLTH